MCVQFAVLFSAYMSVVSATRDVARWTAVHPHATDATTISTVSSRLPTNMDPARLTIGFTPACTSLASGKCAARAPGTQLEVQLTYNVIDLLFLRSLTVGNFSVTIPSTLPSYSMFVQVEPS